MNALLDEIKTHIDASLKNATDPVAGFDADGTLWKADVGEVLLRYVIKNDLIDAIKGKPFDFFSDMYRKDKVKALSWVTQIYQNIPEEEVLHWSEKGLEEEPIEPIPFVKEIIDFLQSRGVAVYLVTASLKWSAIPAASKLYGIRPEHVIGNQTRIKEGVISNELIQPLSLQKGKVERFFEATKKTPFFCAGNSMDDLPLIKMASHIKLAIKTSTKNDDLFETENTLQGIAKSSRWFFWNEESFK